MTIKRLQKLSDNPDALCQLMANNLPQAALLLFDRDKRYIVVEGDLIGQIGFRQEQMLGHTLEELVGEESLKLLGPIYDETLAGQSLAQRLVLGERHYEVRTNPVKDSDDSVVGGMLLALDVTEEFTLRRELLDSQAKLRAIFENSQQGFVLVSPTGTIRAMNQVAKEYASMHGIEAIREGDSLVEKAPAALRTTLEEQVRLSMELGRPVTIERQVEFQKAPTQWFEMSFIPVEGEDQELYGVLITVLNTEDRHLATAALEQSEQRFRSLVQNSTDIISIVDEDGLLVYETAVAERLLGSSSDERIGKPGFLPVHRDDQRRVQSRLRAIRDIPGAMSSVEFRIAGQHEEVSWLESVMHNRLDDPNVQGIVITSRDITERRSSEEQLRLLATAISTAEEAVLITDADLEGPGPRIVFVNEGFSRMSGFSREEILGKSPRILQGPRTNREMLERLQRVIARGEPFSAETINYRKDGSEYVVEWRISPVLDDNGVISHYVSIQRDVTARKAVEQEMEVTTRELADRNNQLEIARHEAERAREAVEKAAEELQRAYEEAATARREAEQASEAKSQFLANMSHEIRTPMTAILGFARLFRQRDDLDEQTQGFVEQIVGAGEHLLGLINDILDLSRVEAGEVTIEREAIDLPELIQEIVEFYRPLAARKNIKLTSEVEEIPGLVLLDRGRLRQIVTNLLTNAIKFTEEGYVSLAVEWVNGTGVRFEISDTGPGIPPEEQESIFEPFYQMEQIRRKGIEGSGLGLTITARLIHAMEGSIEIESEEGEGTSFLVTLPCQLQRGKQPEQQPLQPVKKNDLEAGQETLTVLVADDHPANRMLLEHVLGSRGHRVELCKNGKEAVDAFRSKPCDLMILDVQMPVMDGLEAIRSIRQLPGGDRIPILSLTAYAMASDREKALAAGADEYLAKPFDPVELLEIVARLGQVGAAPAGALEVPVQLVLDFLQDIVVTAQSYVDRLPEDEELGRWAHRVAGTGGSFGLPELSREARTLESSLASKAPKPELLRAVQALLTQAEQKHRDRSAEQG